LFLAGRLGRRQDQARQARGGVGAQAILDLGRGQHGCADQAAGQGRLLDGRAERRHNRQQGEGQQQRRNQDQTARQAG
jgi:hypothetical protein